MNQPAKAPAWYLEAIKEIGTREQPDNRGPAIRRYIALAHCGHEGDPWCAIFVNAMLERAGQRSTRSASSQSFRRLPNSFIKLSGPAIGAIVVCWRGRPDSGLGHVGFYNGEHGAYVSILGGNEGDMVKIELLPKSSNHFGVVGYYWPFDVPLPPIGPIAVIGDPAVSFKVT